MRASPGIDRNLLWVYRIMDHSRGLIGRINSDNPNIELGLPMARLNPQDPPPEYFYRYALLAVRLRWLECGEALALRAPLAGPSNFGTAVCT
jgi:hypothetical protein